MYKLHFMHNYLPSAGNYDRVIKLFDGIDDLQRLEKKYHFKTHTYR